MIQPLVSIIIVNYNGRYLLYDCLTALQKTNFPQKKLEIIVVDNNSQDDSISYIRRYFPKVKLIEAKENIGFTGGNNLGFEHARGKYIALLNSDTRVTPNWLLEMLKTALDPKVGIVAPKLYYDLPYLEITIESNVINRSDLDASADFSPLGVLMENVHCRSDEFSSQVWYRLGFHKERKGNITTRWTKGQAKVLLPFKNEVEEYIFTFHGYKSSLNLDNEINFKLKGKILAKIRLKPNQVLQYKLKLNLNQVQNYFQYLIQNAGNIILKDGWGKDRGSVLRIKDQKVNEFYDFDHPYYNKPQKLLAFCGAACLIKRKLLDQIGFFDGFYFMYYEDLDLSLRAWKKGWDIVYAPKSVIYHKHRATTGSSSDSGFFINLVERNHLSFILTHFPLTVFITEFNFFLIRLIISHIKAILFKFTDNLKTAFAWEIRAEARDTALKFIATNFFRIYQKKLFWQKREIRNYHQFKKLLY